MPTTSVLLALLACDAKDDLPTGGGDTDSDTDSDSDLAQIRVEDFNDINGLDVTTDDVIVAQDFYLDRTTYLFDLDGTQLASFELPFESSGVACFTP